jgi:hypothetical protein
MHLMKICETYSKITFQTISRKTSAFSKIHVTKMSPQKSFFLKSAKININFQPKNKIFIGILSVNSIEHTITCSSLHLKKRCIKMLILVEQLPVGEWL